MILFLVLLLVPPAGTSSYLNFCTHTTLMKDFAYLGIDISVEVGESISPLNGGIGRDHIDNEVGNPALGIILEKDGDS